VSTTSGGARIDALPVPSDGRPRTWRCLTSRPRLFYQQSRLSIGANVNGNALSTPLRAVEPPTVDVEAAAQAVTALMAALGMDVDDPVLRRTPQRVARAYAELLGRYDFDLTTFPNDEGYDELVVARDIPFTSLCEHHLLPFVGTASVGYLPGGRILGLSKLARVVELFARRPQVQERMTKQVATWLDTHLHPRGVGVVIRAEHTCMTLRGVHARGATTVTSSLLGTVRDDGRTRAEFLSFANG
jgi:GTP cyclohydrolase I